MYCKFQGFSVSYIQHIRINSSKVYCKCSITKVVEKTTGVLIVAKWA